MLNWSYGIGGMGVLRWANFDDLKIGSNADNEVDCERCCQFFYDGRYRSRRGRFAITLTLAVAWRGVGWAEGSPNVGGISTVKYRTPYLERYEG